MNKTAPTGPLITVLVPCCNVEKYVEQCVDSLRRQTHSNLEILCINDGSSDSTPAILDRLAKADSRIRVIHKKNTGYGHSMNLGLSQARGDYVGILESDDFAEPDMFEKLLANAEACSLDISRAGYYEHRTSDGVDTPVPTDYVPKNRVMKPIDEPAPFYQPPAIWSSLYRSEFLKKNGIRFLETPGASFQDTSFAFKCYFAAERFMMINDPVLHYRVDNANSSVNNPKKVFCVCDEYEEIWRHAKADPVRFEKIKTLIPVLQLGAYKWNFNRLSRPLRKVFLKRFHEEFRAIQQAGHIEWNLYSRHDKKIVAEAVWLPFLLMFRRSL